MPQAFNDNDFLIVEPGRKVYFLSNGFIGATISHSSNGLLPFRWSNTNDTISFTPSLPMNATSGSMIINATKGSCEKFTLYLMTPIVGLSPIPLLNVATRGSDYTFSVKSQQMDEKPITHPWSLSIVQFRTGKSVYECKTTRKAITISTITWIPGIYIVKATIGGQDITRKIVIDDVFHQ